MSSDLMLSRSTFMTSLLLILYRNDDHSILINSNGEWKNDEQRTYSWLCESKEWTAISIDNGKLTIECVIMKYMRHLVWLNHRLN